MHVQDVYSTIPLHSGDPSKVDLPGPASQIACGDNHSVILLSSGEIYTFGKHKVNAPLHTNIRTTSGYAFSSLTIF